MQTFLPYADYGKSASCLDYRRLGKQRIETLQILNALSGRSKGWVNHPATKMWKGYEYSLIVYGMTMCEEWISRGYKDTTYEKILDFISLYVAGPRPRWLNDEFCASHRSNLLRKAPDHYSQFGWSEPDNLPYIWPV